MKKLSQLCLVLFTLLSFNACHIYYVTQSSSISSGENFSALVKLYSSTPLVSSYTPIACVQLPTGWVVNAVSYVGTIDGFEISGEPEYNDVDSYELGFYFQSKTYLTSDKKLELI